MSVYSEKRMAIRATLQTKLACAALIIIIANVCFLVAIIALISQNETCRLRRKSVHGVKRVNPIALKLGTNIAEYPWMLAFMLLPDEIFIGTAAIISTRWAVTTAYCIQQVDKYPISKRGFRGGSTYWNKYGFLHFAATVIIHNKYNDSTLDYNVGLIQVVNPFVNKHEQPVAMGYTNFKSPEVSTEVVGWATIKDKPKTIIDALLHINVKLLSKKLCKEILEKFKTDSSIYRSLCAFKKAEKYKAKCDFSSGSSLLRNRRLIGISSSGVLCSASSLPGIYTNITEVITWIEEIIQKENVTKA